MMIKNVSKPTPVFAASDTVVWWDLDTCPLPNGYHPSLIVPRIDTELRNLGYNGSLTIVALGNLEGIPDFFLRVLIDAGVVIKHITSANMSFMHHFDEFETMVESPVTIMVISGPVVVAGVTDRLCERKEGYNFLLAYPPSCPPEFPHPPSLVVCGEWHWTRKSLLHDSPSDKQTRTLDQSFQFFSCSCCFFESIFFQDLIEHFESEEHLHKSAIQNEIRESKFHWIASQEANARKKAARKEARKQSKVLQEAKATKEATNQSKMSQEAKTWREARNLSKVLQEAKTEEATHQSKMLQEAKAWTEEIKLSKMLQAAGVSSLPVNLTAKASQQSEANELEAEKEVRKRNIRKRKANNLETQEEVGPSLVKNATAMANKKQPKAKKLKANNMETEETHMGHSP